jgi:hypothetical protein
MEVAMTSINNDQELRAALVGLSPLQQRRLGGLFVESALDLCDDARIRHALTVAMDANATEEECEDAFHSAKSYAIHSYTECGRDTDWARQAAHFVAAAAACLLADDDNAGVGNRAWKAAMQVRNARNCALVVQESDAGVDEAARQFQIANEFLEA